MKKIICIIMSFSFIFSAIAFAVDEEEAVPVQITLTGDTASADSDAVEINGSEIVIVQQGIYELSGNLDGGSIVINAPKTDTVELVLNNVLITNYNAPTINAQNGQIEIKVPEGTESTLACGTGEGLDINACIYSRRDLKIKGSGALNINANDGHGIRSKADIDIKNTTLTITSAESGIKGDNSVEIESGSITVSSGGDGIKSDNIEEEGKGYIDIIDGVINIETQSDGIQADMLLTVNGGTITINATGDGMKANSSIEGGAIADGYVCINSGEITITAGESAVQGNERIDINGGNLTLDSVGIMLKATAVNLLGGIINGTNAPDFEYDIDNDVDTDDTTVEANDKMTSTATSAPDSSAVPEETALPENTNGPSESSRPEEISFSDISGHWAEKSINQAISMGILKGITKTEFKPEEKLTRAMFMTILSRLSKEDLSKYRVDIFNDVKQSSWFYAPISYAYTKRIMSGTSEDLFSPDENITREQIMTSIHNYKKAYAKEEDMFPTVDLSLLFDDSNMVSDWARGGAAYCTAKGYVSGKGERILDPSGFATRAEAAEIIMKLVN